MRTETQNFLGRLETISWFSNVGKPVTSNVVSVKTWNQASKACSQGRLSNVSLVAQGELTSTLSANFPERDKKWNDLVQEIQGNVFALTELAIHGVPLKGKAMGAVREDISWNLLGWAMEIEFMDIVEPVFHSELGEWYKAGHFPCGWTGVVREEWPQTDGTLMVF